MSLMDYIYKCISHRTLNSLEVCQIYFICKVLYYLKLYYKCDFNEEKLFITSLLVIFVINNWTKSKLTLYITKTP